MAAPAAPPPTATPTPAPTPAPAPAAPETPMSRMKQRMQTDSVMADLSDPDPMRTVKAKTKAQEPPPAPPKQPEETPAPSPETDPLDPDTEEAPKSEPKPEDTPPPPDKPMTDEKGKVIDPKKVSPWKLLDQFKGRLTAAEKENIELKERLAKVPDIAKLEGIDKRNKELEEEIRYTNYAKSQEFQEKYQKPYEEAWTKAVSDLGELEVLAEDGSVARKATASDLISLARMPLGEARKLANQMFGDSASDVMMHRQKIRDLSDAQNKALEDARKSGSERETQWIEKSKAIQSELSTLWQKFNNEDAAKHDFLRVKEGDAEWNTRLEKAKALVEGSFNHNPADPNLTPEQRAKAVRDRVAVKNRAIAFSPMKVEIKRLRAQLAERDEKLKAYENSEPTGGSAGGTNGKPAPASTPMERARQRLHASATPAPNYF